MLLGQLEAIYRQLDLGDFAPARVEIEAYLSANKNHQTNRYLLTPDERRTITRRWGNVIGRYGYEANRPR